jgi:hypothetical protein
MINSEALEANIRHELEASRQNEEDCFHCTYGLVELILEYIEQTRGSKDMKRRKFGEPIKMYLVEEDRLAKLLEIEHRYNFEQMESGDQREYFYRMLVEGGDAEYLTYRGLTDLVNTMTFESLAEMDLGLYEELEEGKND